MPAMLRALKVTTPPAARSQRIERQKEQHADDHDDGEESGRRQRRRPTAQHDAVDGPEIDRDGDEDIAGADLEPCQRAQIAARDDGRDPGQRQAHARHLQPARALAERDPDRHEDEDRRRRIEQRAVDRGRAGEADIDHGVEQGDADQRVDDEAQPFPPDDVARSDDAAERERQERQRRHHPAPEGERHRRHVAAQAAPRHPVAAPEQGGQDQERIGRGDGAPERRRRPLARAGSAAFQGISRPRRCGSTRPHASDRSPC